MFWETGGRSHAKNVLEMTNIRVFCCVGTEFSTCTYSHQISPTMFPTPFGSTHPAPFANNISGNQFFHPSQTSFPNNHFTNKCIFKNSPETAQQHHQPHDPHSTSMSNQHMQQTCSPPKCKRHHKLYFQQSAVYTSPPYFPNNMSDTKLPHHTRCHLHNNMVDNIFPNASHSMSLVTCPQ